MMPAPRSVDDRDRRRAERERLADRDDPENQDDEEEEERVEHDLDDEMAHLSLLGDPAAIAVPRPSIVARQETRVQTTCPVASLRLGIVTWCPDTRDERMSPPLERAVGLLRKDRTARRDEEGQLTAPTGPC